MVQVVPPSGLEWKLRAGAKTAPCLLKQLCRTNLRPADHVPSEIISPFWKHCGIVPFLVGLFTIFYEKSVTIILDDKFLHTIWYDHANFYCEILVLNFALTRTGLSLDMITLGSGFLQYKSI
jgi:hypothetical protein